MTWNQIIKSISLSKKSQRRIWLRLSTYFFCTAISLPYELPCAPNQGLTLRLAWDNVMLANVIEAEAWLVLAEG